MVLSGRLLAERFQMSQETQRSRGALVWSAAPCRRFCFACARQGALTWGGKSPTSPTGGIVSRTARVSTARWNLKEAAGKALARRTETAYEACKLDEKAHIFKVRYLYGKLERICGGHKREGECAIPGEICQPV